MKPSVAQKYTEFTTKFEGKLPYMYLDVKELVTTGIGNLIDPIGAALSLPWKRPDGSRATQAEISDAWHRVKSRTDLAQRGGGAFSGITTIRLDNDGIREVVNRKLLENEQVLRTRFPSYDNWPADAQMGLLSMAWALGPNFHFPKFEAAVNQLLPDFKTAAIEGHMNTTGNPGLVPRNEANALLFTNAANALKFGYNLDDLHWPDIVPEIKKAVTIGATVYGLGAVASLVGYAAYKKFQKRKA
jgi:GH24 family phage-related lysozyme (muramidase)